MVGWAVIQDTTLLVTSPEWMFAYDIDADGTLSGEWDVSLRKAHSEVSLALVLRSGTARIVEARSDRSGAPVAYVEVSTSADGDPAS